MALCKKGLHEVDPSDPWYKKKWVEKNRLRCRDCYRAKQSRAVNRYNATQKRKASHARFNVSPKRRANNARYEKTRLRIMVGGVRLAYRVRPERKQALQTVLADKRAAMKGESREAL